jgi:hypothetical protein
MIKSILKANSWYDDLKEPNRTLFFFFVLMPLICGSQFLLDTIYGDIGYIYWAFCMFALVIFRMTPSIVDIRNMHKKRKKLEKDLEN